MESNVFFVNSGKKVWVQLSWIMGVSQQNNRVHLYKAVLHLIGNR